MGDHPRYDFHAQQATFYHTMTGYRKISLDRRTLKTIYCLKIWLLMSGRVLEGEGPDGRD